ncbi:unnamed protein product [Lymnaea stagnalis]|uniref:RNA helicase n=1 Tax=Lymnaea stagnalis TaxID=6523 RepID=A0AAV2GZA7_LYMST
MASFGGVINLDRGENGVNEKITDYLEDEYFSDGEHSADEKYEIEGPEKTMGPKGAPKLDLRDYQLELAENALKGLNTIICAPTGSGKTRVATHIILEHLKHTDGRKKRIAFLARTVPLTLQQYKSLKTYLPREYQITYITGQSEESMRLKSVVKHNHVVVMTPMILQNNILRKAFRLSKFTLVIFDECHHTRKDEPYNTLMFSYLKAKIRGSEEVRANLPQIVGLTASIGIEKAKSVDEATESILNVLGNLDVISLSTVKNNLHELQQMVPVPEEKVIPLTQRDDDDAIKKIIHIMEELEAHVADHILKVDKENLITLLTEKPVNKKTQDYAQWAVKLKQEAKSVPIKDPLKETNIDVRFLIILSEYLVTYNIALEAHDLVELRDVLAYLDMSLMQFNILGSRTRQEKTFYQYFENLKVAVANQHSEENPNLTVLGKTLLDNLKVEGSRCIIFVRTRALAEALAAWLNRSKNSFLRHLNAKIFTGINASVEQGGMSPKLQEDTIASFRTGAIRVLVSTSVGEEGLDIPDCNLVIKYNHVGNEVTTVQTKGRARKLGGVSFLLAMDHVRRRESGNQAKAQIMEQAIKKISAMETRKIEQFIDEYQLRVIVEAEIEEANKEKRKKDPQEKQFRMVCSLCRKVGINNTQIRTIYGKHRVSIDRDFLNSGQLKQVPRRGNIIIDDIEFLGPVYCQGQPVPGKICGHVLGTMIKYNKVTYFAMGIKKFGFYLGNDTNLKNFKQWDKVPYVIDELSNDDTLRYLSSASAETSYYESDSDTETSSDEDYTMTQRQREDREVRMRQSSEDTSVKTLANAMQLTSQATNLALGELERNQMLDPERTGLSTYNRLFNQPLYSSSNTFKTINIQQTMSIPSAQYSHDSSDTE